MQEANTPAAVEPGSEVRPGIGNIEPSVEARLRLEHEGRWVAWAADDQSVIAVGDTHAEVRAAARQLGLPRAVCEWMPPAMRFGGP